MNAEWFVASAGTYLGPYTRDELRKLHAAGTIAPQSMVHRAGEPGRPVAAVLTPGGPAAASAIPQPPPLPQRRPPAPQPAAQGSVAPNNVAAARAPASGAVRRAKPSKAFNALLMGVSIALGGVAAMFIARLVIPAFQPKEPEPLEAVSPEPKRKAPTSNSGSRPFWESKTAQSPSSATPATVMEYVPSSVGDEPQLVVPSDLNTAPTSPAEPVATSGPRPQVGFSNAPKPVASPSTTRPISPTFQ